MSGDITAGFFPDCGNLRGGYIRVFAWQAPEFGQRDPQIGHRPKLYPVRSIIVERYVSETEIRHASVRWSNGDYIQLSRIKEMRIGIRRCIQHAIEETMRLAGAGRRRK